MNTTLNHQELGRIYREAFNPILSAPPGLYKVHPWWKIWKRQEWINISDEGSKRRITSWKGMEVPCPSEMTAVSLENGKLIFYLKRPFTKHYQSWGTFMTTTDLPEARAFINRLNSLIQTATLVRS